MRISIDKITLRNFLSYGNTIQEIPFLPGVNIITGDNRDRGGSNGSGKSSALEGVLFALFGKTFRGIVKKQIVNWKNRKNCVVEIFFTKGTNKYKVVRGIAPDVFEIWENDNLIDKPSHVKDYQLILDSIIGINFQTFSSLIYSNVNSPLSKPILGMSKPEKRAFLEKVFGLELYTSITKLCNEKLITVNDKIKNNDSYIQGNYIRIDDNLKSINILKKRLKEYGTEEGALKEANILFKDFLNDIGDLDIISRERDNCDDILQNLKINVNALYLICDGIESKKTKMLGKLDIINKDIRTIEKEEKAFIKVDPDKLNELKEEKGVLLEEIEKTIEYLDRNNKTIQTMDTDLNVSLSQRKIINNNIQIIEREGKCPTCGSDVIGNGILDDLKKDLKAYNITISGCNDQLLILRDTNDKLTSLKLDANQRISTIEKDINELENTVDIDSLLKRKELLVKDKKRYSSVIQCYRNIKTKIEKEREDDNSQIVEWEDKRNGFHYKLQHVETFESKISVLEEKVKIEKKASKDIEEDIQKSRDIISNTMKENDKRKENTKRLNNIKDYLNFMKTLCKDDKIKQYAAGSIIPYINKNTNKYLKESEHSFYILIDKWLETEIKGPGVKNASYGSLSGGESKSVDLSLQLAFVDASRVLAGTYPDIVLHDELLDSSMDGKGVEDLMGIIRSKQAEDNSKFFLISHRDELENMEFDNVYHVVKEKGFSKIIVN